jgi:hypothetical protein
MRKVPKPKPLISPAFKRDFPEFVARADALGVRIQPSPTRRRGKPLTYWLDGYRQLTGYDTRADRAPFTHEDAVRHIDEVLTDIEEGRAKIAVMTVADRFAEVMAEFRKIRPQQGMIGEIRLPCGDRGHVWFMARYSGGVHLHGIGDVAKAEVPWRYGVTPSEQLAACCDLLVANFSPPVEAPSHD